MVVTDILRTMSTKAKPIPTGKLVVTKRGRPVARIMPRSGLKSGSLLGSLLHEEDLLAPVAAKWDARR